MLEVCHMLLLHALSADGVATRPHFQFLKSAFSRKPSVLAHPFPIILALLSSLFFLLFPMDIVCVPQLDYKVLEFGTVFQSYHLTGC